MHMKPMEVDELILCLLCTVSLISQVCQEYFFTVIALKFLQEKCLHLIDLLHPFPGGSHDQLPAAESHCGPDDGHPCPAQHGVDDALCPTGCTQGKPPQHTKGM